MSQPPDDGSIPDLSQFFAGGGPTSGPVNWEVARQVALSVAGGGRRELPVTAGDPGMDGLVRAAEMALERAGALSRGPDLPRVGAPTRAEWLAETIDSLRPLIERLATRLHDTGGALGLGSAVMPGLDGIGGDAETDMAGEARRAMEAVMRPLAPVFMGFQLGMVLGFVTTRALSQYDLCLPREGAGVLSVIVGNVDAAASDMGVPRDELRMWVAMHEVVHHSQFAIGWVRRRLLGLLEAYLDSIRLDLSQLQEQLQDLDPSDPESLQRFADTADTQLGTFIVTDQPDVLESALTVLSMLEGYADHLVATAASGLLPHGADIGHGLARRSAEGGDAGRLLESLLGVQLTDERIEEGRSFCVAVSARAGMDALNRIWEGLDTFPTADEVRRPEQWLARMEHTPPGGLL